MNTPVNHGKAWRPIDDMDLLTRFDGGAALPGLCATLGRTPYALVTRLQALGALCLVDKGDGNAYYARVSADAWIGFKEINLLSKEYE